MGNQIMEQFGFKLNRNSTHTARTLMLDEVNLLLDWVNNPDASIQDYMTAIIEQNCLNKRSFSNRKITARHMINLYGLDPNVAIFRTLFYIWKRDVEARPLLALLIAYCRDSILHDTAQNFSSIPYGEVITCDITKNWVNNLEPNRFSESTLVATARNLNSSWTQTGHFEGRVQKIRIQAKPSAGVVVLALFLGYLSGIRGIQLFQSEYMMLLDISEHEAIVLAQEASQKSWITFKRIAEVIEVQFPHFLQKDEKELLVEQS